MATVEVDVAHDPGQLEVLRRVDRGDAGSSSSARSSSGMIPPTTTGASTPISRSSSSTSGDELEVRAGEDRQADHVGVLVARRRRDLLGVRRMPE